MCMLTFVPAGVTPDVTGILNGAEWNNDGHGWAIVGKDRIYSGKGFDAAIVAEQFANARRKHDGPALFHSRWATHGAVVTENVHPFKVGRDRKTVVAHNGILPKLAHPAKGDARSDTRKFAQDLLPVLWRDLDNAHTRDSLAEWLGSNKIVILTANRSYSKRAYLFGESLGTWAPDGLWYSNSDYRFGRAVFAPVPRASRDWRYSWEIDTKSAVPDCVVCDSPLGAMDEECASCGTCVYCEMNAVTDCDCYSVPGGTTPTKYLH